MIMFDWKEKSQSYQIELPNSLLSFLSNDSGLDLPFEIFTEYNRFDNHDVVTKFRAHPNYQGVGEWFDNSYVQYEKPHGRRNNNHEQVIVDVPCKIFGFIAIDNVTHALIHPCDFKSVDYSVITKKWKLCYTTTDQNQNEPSYEIVACDTLSGHCFLFPDTVPGQCIQVIEVEKWPGLFSNAFNSI